MDSASLEEEKQNGPAAQTRRQLELLQDPTECPTLRSHTAKILELVAHQEARRVLMSPKAKGLPTLISQLESTSDVGVITNILSTFKALLSIKHERCQIIQEMVKINFIQSLLRLQQFVSQNIGPPGCHAINSLAFSLLNKIAIKDKKLSVKLRLLGYLKPFLSSFQGILGKSKVLIPALILLRHLLRNSTNSKFLGKEGVIASLLHIVERQKSRGPVMLHALECLTAATWNKANVSTLLQSNGLPQLLALLTSKDWVPSKRRDLRLLRACLEVLIHVAYTKAGRNHLVKVDAMTQLVQWCQVLPLELEAWEPLASLVVLIIQRLLPPLPLPVSSPHHLMSFNLCKDAANKVETLGSGEDEESESGSGSDGEEEDFRVNQQQLEMGDLPDTGQLSCEEIRKLFRFFPEISKEELRNLLRSSVEGGDPGAATLAARREARQVGALPNPPESRSPPPPAPGQPSIYIKQAAHTRTVTPIMKLAYPEMKAAAWSPQTIPPDNDLEPFHHPTAHLFRSKLIEHTKRRDDSSRTVVYDYDHLALNHSSSPEKLTNQDEEELDEPPLEHLQFESRFECGNLRKVFKTGPMEYDLVLNPDINTTSHHQWFYFEVRGMEGGQSYTFNIINCEKSRSLYLHGMSPVFFSLKSFLNNQAAWCRVPQSACYFRNQYVKDNSMASVLKDGPYYTLSFTVTFPYSGDICYLAYHYPYSYSLLQTHLERWLSNYDFKSIYFEQHKLCETLSGNPVPLLTITAKPPDSSRTYIVLTARVHPGESNSSWVMKGVVDFLLSSSPQAHFLRQHYVFKVVPMLNPDGVINGNYRCSLIGADLNRQWTDPNESLHPSIFHTRHLIQFLVTAKRPPLIFCDFHGHSRKKNVFLYGCSPSLSWLPRDASVEDTHLYEILPILLSHMAPAFSLDNCQYTVPRNRESTARISVWRQFKVLLSYTMECTYGGCDQGPYAGYQLGIPQLEEMGAKFCQALVQLTPGVVWREGWPSLDTSHLPHIGLALAPPPESPASHYSSDLDQDTLPDSEEDDT